MGGFMKLNRAHVCLSAPVRFAFSLSAILLFISAEGAQDRFPTKGWPKAEPASVGLDSAALGALDADIASGKYGLVDTMLVIRCRKQAYEGAHPPEYGKIYGHLPRTPRPPHSPVNRPPHSFPPP